MDTQAGPGLDRRSLLLAGVAGVAAAALAPASAAEAATTSGPVPLTTDQSLHLLRRATFGATPSLISSLASKGRTAWLDEQMHPSTIDDSACTAALKRFPALTMSTAQIRASYPNGSWDVPQQLIQATLLRQMVSKRQLFEVMVDFWSNHLNIATPNEKTWDYKSVDDRLVIRKHALGRFSDLLLASAKSPAMLSYLDNAISRGSDPNENYGRELLELHTVGVGARYTEADVRNSTMALTGWSIHPTTGLFQYRPDWRHVGPVKVLGWSSSNGSASNGVAVGESYLRYLAHHPKTASRICKKLAVRFISDSPSATVVADLAKVYLANDTAIVPVLKALFAHAEFKASVGKKMRRPLDSAIAAFRVLGVKPSSDTQTEALGGLTWALGKAGHVPFGWPLPDGYPEKAAPWLTTTGMLERWNLHEAISGHWFTKGLVLTDLSKLLGTTKPATAGAFVDRLCTRLLNQHVSSAHRAALLAFLELKESDPVPDWMLTYRVQPLTSLILSSPYWALR